MPQSHQGHNVGLPESGVQMSITWGELASDASAPGMAGNVATLPSPEGMPMAHVDTDALRRLADDFENNVGVKLAAARTRLADAQGIEYSNFTNVHLPLALVYVEAFNFQNRDLETKRTTASQFRTNLRATADAWDLAEQHNTVTPGGAG
jgi:hypothetical protein